MTDLNRTPRLVILVVCLTLIFAFAALPANAQTVTSIITTTTLFGGSQNTTASGSTAYSAPFPGVILTGTAISTITGKPVRHLWYSDEFSGLCRIDPEVDDVLPAVNGVGGHSPNLATCVSRIQARPITPGQVAFDPLTNTLYTADRSGNGAGIVRLHYLPAGDSGQGSIDLVRVESLIGTQTGRNAFGGCPQLKDPKTNTLVPVAPTSATLGPDGALYTGSLRDGAIVRILSPATFNPATQCPDPNKLNRPGDQIQIPILSADEKVGSGHTFGLGFLGTTLFGADNIAPWILPNATQCLVGANKICGSPALGGQLPMPTEILTTQIPSPQGGLATDAVFGQSAGSVVYAATLSSVARLANFLSPTALTLNLNYGGSFQSIVGLAADPADTTASTVYVGDDPTAGNGTGAGRIWQVTPQAANVPPGVPAITSATAGPGTGQARVTWAPTLNGAAIATYVVKTLFAPAVAGVPPTPTAIPNVTVTAPATTAIISGLVPGTAYEFEVQACNTFGCSAFSSPSAPVAAITVGPPPSPVNVVGTAVGDGVSASISWTQPGNGNSPIISSTIVTNAPLGALPVAATLVPGAATGGAVHGLTCGNSYTFSVIATNAVGNSAASATSSPVAIACLTAADVSLTMTAPASINPGSILTYSVTVHDAGPAAAPQVTISDVLPAPFASTTFSQGVCAGTVGATIFTCNLGALAANGTATFTVSVQLPLTQTTGTFTNTATANVLGATGLNVDPNLANNTASATTTVGTPVDPCPATTTDIQVVGSSTNGNPVHGTPDTFTWQIHNNLGTVAANCVSFTLATTAPGVQLLSIVSLNVSGGTTPACTIAATATAATCSLGTIAGGQTAIVTAQAVASTPGLANSYAMTGSAQLGTGSTDTNAANNSFKVSIGAQ
jgi:uncharacterized repeat protein (TIGR01451 family)